MPQNLAIVIFTRICEHWCIVTPDFSANQKHSADSKNYAGFVAANPYARNHQKLQMNSYQQRLQARNPVHGPAWVDEIGN